MGFLDTIGKFFSSVPIIGDLIGMGGSYLGQAQARSQFNQNLDFQAALAKHGLRWRVEDAKAAGLHPLVGAGVSPQSSSPVYAGGGEHFLSRFGQDISRAIAAKKTPEERLMEKIKLLQEGEKLKAMRKANEEVNTPGMPGIGQSDISGQDAAVKRIPSEIVSSGSQGHEAGVKPKYQYVVSGNKIESMPSKEMAEVIEGSTFHNIKEVVGQGLNYARNLQAYQFPWGPGSRKVRYELSRVKSKIISHLMRTGDLPSGSDVRYDARGGNWLLVRNARGVSLYAHRSKAVADYWRKRIR